MGINAAGDIKSSTHSLFKKNRLEKDNSRWWFVQYARKWTDYEDSFY